MPESARVVTSVPAGPKEPDAGFPYAIAFACGVRRSHEMQEIGTPMLPGKALVAESDIEFLRR